MNDRQTGSDLPTATVALMVQTAQEKPRFLLVDYDGFSIGSGAHCDLQLAEPGIPRWHSTLHVQGQVVWIEAADDAALVTIDGAPYRRRALRDGDRLSFGQTELVISIGDVAVQTVQSAVRGRQFSEDLSSLSADELCNRIEQEEMQVHEFNRRRRFGWQALLSAVQAANTTGTGVAPATAVSLPESVGPSGDKLDELVAQVRGLSETLEERTKALSTQESVLMDSSAQLADVQLRVSRQLEQLLNRLSHEDDQPGELRVSA